MHTPGVGEQPFRVRVTVHQSLGEGRVRVRVGVRVGNRVGVRARVKVKVCVRIRVWVRVPRWGRGTAPPRPGRCGRAPLELPARSRGMEGAAAVP